MTGGMPFYPGQNLSSGSQNNSLIPGAGPNLRGNSNALMMGGGDLRLASGGADQQFLASLANYSRN